METGEIDDMRLPDVIPDWVLADWPLPSAPAVCTCEPTEPEPVRWAIPGVTWGAAAPAGPVPVSPMVRALQAAAAAVCALDPGLASPEQAMSDAEAVEAVSQQLRVHGVRRLADVTARELHALRGYRSAGAWLRDTRPDADSTDARLATRLRGHAMVTTAVDGGDLSLGAARKVLAALGRCRPHVDQPDRLIDCQPGEQVVTAVVGHVVDLVAGCLLGLHDDHPLLIELLTRTTAINASVEACAGQLERLEAAFVLLATHVPVSMLGSCLEELVLAVVPSLLEERDARGRERAGLDLQLKGDGTGWHLEGDLDLQCGERLWTALRAEARRDPHNPADTAAAAALRAEGIDPYDETADGATAGGARAGAGHAPTDAAQAATDAVGGVLIPDGAAVDVDPATGWPRSRRHRMHDAFNALLGRYLEHGLGGTSHKTPVQVNVTLTADALTGAPGARPPTADSGATISRTLLRRWWCDSNVTAYVLSRGGQALRAVHLGRTLTALERRGAHLEHRNRCAGVGCCRSGLDPTVELRPHHVIGYADSGSTSLDDTILVCDVLHRDIHEGHRRVRLRNGRHLTEAGWA